MIYLKVFTYYLSWHYSRALRDFFHVWKNFLWFIYHYFSITCLLRTFFAPWRRMREEYRTGFHPQNFFSTLFVNTILRLVGVLVRFSVVMAGVAALAVTTMGGALAFLVWLTLPVLVHTMLVWGIVLLAV